jgi:hypothetical protein
VLLRRLPVAGFDHTIPDFSRSPETSILEDGADHGAALGCWKAVDAVPPGTPSIMLLRCALTFLMLVFLGVTAGAAEEPADHGEHDFGDCIVVFTLEYEDDLLPSPPWALAEAKIRRLGNVFFLTGIQPEGLPAQDNGDAPPPPARRSWIPLADVVRMAEYDDVESALRALEIGNAADDGGRPVMRSVSKSTGNSPSKAR